MFTQKNMLKNYLDAIKRAKKISGAQQKEWIYKAIRIPRSAMNEEASYAFALKFVLSDNGKIDTILASKYTPTAMKESLTLPAQYKDVHWEDIFNRKLRKGDVLIVPISIYYPEGSSLNLHEFNVDDLFDFQFPGKAERFSNCLLMQTLVVHYRKSMR
jgi:hypothetical protein